MILKESRWLMRELRWRRILEQIAIRQMDDESGRHNLNLLEDGQGNTTPTRSPGNILKLSCSGS